MINLVDSVNRYTNTTNYTVEWVFLNQTLLTAYSDENPSLKNQEIRLTLLQMKKGTSSKSHHDKQFSQGAAKLRARQKILHGPMREKNHRLEGEHKYPSSR